MKKIQTALMPFWFELDRLTSNISLSFVLLSNVLGNAMTFHMCTEFMNVLEYCKIIPVKKVNYKKHTPRSLLSSTLSKSAKQFFHYISDRFDSTNIFHFIEELAEVPGVARDQM